MKASLLSSDSEGDLFCAAHLGSIALSLILFACAEGHNRLDGARRSTSLLTGHAQFIKMAWVSIAASLFVLAFET
jgi:hypothetical protein